jgi:galactokinase
MKTISGIRKTIESGKADDKFLDLYLDATMLNYQKDRYLKALDSFAALYGEEKVTIYSAPGRSEVMGNHTDHQQGEILAASVNLDAIAVVHQNDDGIIRLKSDNYPEIKVNVNDIKMKKSEKETTKALVKGVLQGFTDRGYRIGGFEAFVTSDVIIGAGLSSSAAFETLIGTILSYLYNKGRVSATEIAIIGQFAENVYFGKPCGLMDQMACSVGNLVHVDFADRNAPKVEKVDFDLSAHGYSLCITDTKGSHADLTNEYAAIPQEMKAVAGYFGKDVLLGITLEEVMENIAELRSRFGDRAVLRTIHFIEENKRVQRGVEALKNNKINGFLEEVRASGNSSYKYLQNVYTSSDVAHQNVSLALAVSDTVLNAKNEASRVHGGGFAGTIQGFVKDRNVAKYKAAMEKIFGEDSCHVLKIRKYGGVRVLG